MSPNLTANVPPNPQHCSGALISFSSRPATCAQQCTRLRFDAQLTQARTRVVVRDRTLPASRDLAYFQDALQEIGKLVGACSEPLDLVAAARRTRPAARDSACVSSLRKSRTARPRIRSRRTRAALCARGPVRHGDRPSCSRADRNRSAWQERPLRNRQPSSSLSARNRCCGRNRSTRQVTNNPTCNWFLPRGQGQACYAQTGRRVQVVLAALTPLRALIP